MSQFVEISKNVIRFRQSLNTSAASRIRVHGRAGMKECRVKLINVTRATIPNNEQSRNRRVRMKLALFYRVFSVGRR